MGVDVHPVSVGGNDKNYVGCLPLIQKKEDAEKGCQTCIICVSAVVVGAFGCVCIQKALPCSILARFSFNCETELSFLGGLLNIKRVN